MLLWVGSPKWQDSSASYLASVLQRQPDLSIPACITKSPQKCNKPHILAGAIMLHPVHRTHTCSSHGHCFVTSSSAVTVSFCSNWNYFFGFGWSFSPKAPVLLSGRMNNRRRGPWEFQAMLAIEVHHQTCFLPACTADHWQYGQT